MGEHSESQTEASEFEGVSTIINNIGNENGVPISATELQGETEMVQPATDGATQRAEEDEVKETRRYIRRIERKEERAVHALIQECKRERDLEKEIQADDDSIRSEEEDNICRELDKFKKGVDTGADGNIHETGSSKEMQTEREGTRETSQNRVGLVKIPWSRWGTGPVGLAGATLLGLSRDGGCV